MPEVQCWPACVMQGETAHSHRSSTDALHPAYRTDTHQTHAVHDRDTGQRSEMMGRAQLGGKNENPASRQGAQRGIRLFKLRTHQTTAAHFKHSSMNLSTCSTSECSASENHYPPPCVWGGGLTQQPSTTLGTGTVAHCVTLSSSSAPIPLPLLCAGCASCSRR